MICFACGTQNEDDFDLYNNRFICDSCLSILNYHYNEALKEIREENPTVWESNFLEALDEYVIFKSDEYKENLRRERTKLWQK